MTIGVGEVLRTARQERGLTLSDVAEETAISRRKLEALEDERFDALEGDVYVKSSLRLYGRFLNIDPEPLVEAYRREYGEHIAEAPLLPVAEYRERVSPVVTFAIVALVVVIGLGLIGALGDGPAGTVAEATSEQVADAQGPSPAPSPTTPPATGATAEPVPEETGPPPLEEADRVEMALNVSGGASWVRVFVDDERVLEETVEDGYSQTFTGDEIRLRIGNGGAADLVVNGEQLGGFSSGEVVDVTCAAGQSSCTVE